MANPYSIGRNCSLVLLWSGGRINLRDVTGFTSAQETRVQRSDPLNGLPIEFNTPGGWRGSFSTDRADKSLDVLIASIEARFWNSGVIGSGAIYQYITETDNSTTTFEYTGCSLTLIAAGTWAAEGIVRQSLSFYASQRNLI